MRQPLAFRSTTWKQPDSAASPRARRSSTNRGTSSGMRHSCHASLTITVGAADAEQSGDVANRIGGDVALLVLHQIQRGQHRGAAAIRRIARDDVVEARAVL